MNCYASLTEIKAALGISGTGDDTVLLNQLEAASRAIDNYCRRWFYAETATRYFRGAGDTLWLDDLLSITTFKLDQDGDATFEITLAATDYDLWPANVFPKRLVMVSDAGDYGDFAHGIARGVEIAGLWGFGNGLSATPYEASGINVTVATATGTTLTLSADDVIEAGHTILVESEQMFISAVATGQATAQRGVNGTTAAAHSTKEASIYRYPMDVWQACVQAASAMFEKRKAQGMKSERLGDYSYTVATDTVKAAAGDLLASYRRLV